MPWACAGRLFRTLSGRSARVSYGIEPSFRIQIARLLDPLRGRLSERRRARPEGASRERGGRRERAARRARSGSTGHEGRRRTQAAARSAGARCFDPSLPARRIPRRRHGGAGHRTRGRPSDVAGRSRPRAPRSPWRTAEASTRQAGRAWATATSMSNATSRASTACSFVTPGKSSRNSSSGSPPTR